MRSLHGYTRRCLGLLTLAMVASACGTSEAHRKARRGEGDAGEGGPPKIDIDAARHPDSAAPPGPLQYAGSSGPAGGIVMKGGGYILFSVTGEVPGTSGLTKSPNHRMVGGVVGRASY